MNALFNGMQSALNPNGPNAAVISEMSWILMIGGALIFIVVMALAAYAVFGKRQGALRLSARGLIIGGGIVFPVVVLTALLVYSLLRAAAIAGTDSPDALRVEVTGEQWWWRVNYLDEQGAHDFALANELRVPVGRTVELHLKSNDVIHSLWVPALAGKLDMIPGRTNKLRFSASQPGRMRGQCAEYCGGPHALMAMMVVAESGEDYARWAERQRSAAMSVTQDDRLLRGQNVFLALCAGCHTVRGTDAAGVRGPDLTHIGSRLTLGAGMMPVNAGTIAAWITSSQHLKPDNLMPEFRNLSGEDLVAMSSWLEGLK